MKRHNLEHVIFLVLLLAIFGWATIAALSFDGDAQMYPRAVGTAGILLISAELLRYLLAMRRNQSREAVSPADTVTAGIVSIAPYVAWLLSYFAAIYAIGMVAASGLFVTLFLNREGKVRWPLAMLACLVVILFLITMEDVMSLKWPRSLFDPIALFGLH